MSSTILDPAFTPLSDISNSTNVLVSDRLSAYVKQLYPSPPPANHHNKHHASHHNKHHASHNPIQRRNLTPIRKLTNAALPMAQRAINSEQLCVAQTNPFKTKRNKKTIISKKRLNKLSKAKKSASREKFICWSPNIDHERVLKRTIHPTKNKRIQRLSAPRTRIMKFVDRRFQRLLDDKENTLLTKALTLQRIEAKKRADQLAKALDEKEVHSRYPLTARA